MQRQANNKVFRRIFVQKVTTARPWGERKAISHIQPKPVIRLRQTACLCPADSFRPAEGVAGYGEAGRKER